MFEINPYYHKYLLELDGAMSRINYFDRRERTYVKITTQFYDYLKQLYGFDLPHEVLNTLSDFLGVITTVDDTISHPYYEICQI